jgi:hypothetical protein
LLICGLQFGRKLTIPTSLARILSRYILPPYANPSSADHVIHLRSCIAAEPCTKSTDECNSANLGGEARSLVYSTHPLKKERKIVRALIVVHGQGRDADNYFAPVWRRPSGQCLQRHDLILPRMVKTARAA